MPNWKKLIVSGSDAVLKSLNVTTAFTASGLKYPSTDNGEFSFIQTDGSGNLSLQYVETLYEQIVNGEATTIVKGTPVYVSGSQGADQIVYRADAGNPAKMPCIYIAADNIAAGTTGRGILLGLITGVDTTGYPAGTEVFVASGGGWTSTRPTGSVIVQSLGIVTKEGTGGQGVVLNPGPSNLPNLQSGYVWVGNSNSYPIPVTTSSIQNVVSASHATTASSVNPLTQNVLITGSLSLSGSTNIVGPITASTLLVSGSGTQRVTIIGSGSSQPIFTIQGSQGELFSITDSLSGSLFSVNDISGLPILEVFSNGDTLIGDYSAPAVYTSRRITSTTVGINVIYSLATSSYDGIFMDYTIKSGSVGRAGNFMAMWSGSSVDFTDNSINGFGTTSNFTFGASISGSNLIVSGSGSTAGWTVKTIIRGI
jgi:hypothetical protein